MKKISIGIIVLCVLYFLGGWTGTFFDVITKEQYLSYAGLFGGLASVVGLFSFFRPTISKTDIQSLDIETLKSLAVTSNKIKELEQEKAHAQTQLVPTIIEA